MAESFMTGAGMDNHVNANDWTENVDAENESYLGAQWGGFVTGQET